MSEITFRHAIATMSWIDPRTHLPEVDLGGNPGYVDPYPAPSPRAPFRMTRARIVDQRSYRFANLLEAFITIDQGTRHIVARGFTAASGQYRTMSFPGGMSLPYGPEVMIVPQRFGIGSEHYRTFRSIDGVDATEARTSEGNPTVAVFRQTVGCRTVSPEAVTQGLVCVLTAGSSTVQGRRIGHFVQAFPPIWTDLELRIFADGRSDGRLVRHSLFPSNSLVREGLLRPSLADRIGVGERERASPELRPLFDRRADSTGSDDGFRNAMSRWQERTIADTATPPASSEDPFYLEATYDAVPHLDEWKERGWGPMDARGVGPTSGNPWSIEHSGSLDIERSRVPAMQGPHNGVDPPAGAGATAPGGRYVEGS